MRSSTTSVSAAPGMQGATRLMSIRTFQASPTGSGTSNVLSNSIRALPLAVLLSFRGGAGDAAMGLGPSGGGVHEPFHFGEHVRRELVRRLGDPQNVPPSGEPVHSDAEVGKDFTALRIDIVEENHEDMVDLGAGLAQR